jgi:hypothetical protein
MSDCIEAEGSSNSSGYASAWYKGKRMGAHRAAYIEASGEIPEGLHVMHSCDNRRCINPEHLSVGTRSDNMKDCASKGRIYSPMAKLTAEQKQYVLDSPLHAVELAQQLPVTARAIRSMRQRAGQTRPRGGQAHV